MKFKTTISVICCVLVMGCVSQEQKKHNAQIIEAAAINAKLGLQYINNEEYQLASQKLALAMRQAPHLGFPQSTMGLLLERTGDIAGAKKYYKRAISVAPSEGAYLNNYASFLCRQGSYKEAMHYYDKATHKNAYKNIANAYEGAAACAVKQGKPALAVTYYKKALENSPSRVDIWLEISDLSYQRQQYTQSKNYLEKYLAARKPTRRAMTLGVNLAKTVHDPKMMARYSSMLMADTRVQA